MSTLPATGEEEPPGTCADSAASSAQAASTASAASSALSEPLPPSPVLLPGVKEVARLIARFACNNHTICDDELRPVCDVN